jgi:hypothetical protein
MVACDGWCHVVLFIRGHVAGLSQSIKKRELELANWPEIVADDPRFIALKEHLVEVLRRMKMTAKAFEEIR